MSTRDAIIVNFDTFSMVNHESPSEFHGLGGIIFSQFFYKNQGEVYS